jgi:Ras-related protein Rab-7A
LSRRAAPVKTLLLGDAGVGKTALLRQFVDRDFALSYRPTIGADFESKQMELNGSFITLQLWDTAGQERYRSLATAYYRGTEICVFVFDLTCAASFDSLNYWIDSFLNASSTSSSDFPLLLLGNKIDLADKREVTIDRAQAFAEERHLLFYEVSAKTSENVMQAFESVVKKWDDLGDMVLKKSESIVIAEPDNKQSCCYFFTLPAVRSESLEDSASDVDPSSVDS